MLAQWHEIRQTAMDVLRPSEKDLQHGLELHQNSLVFDAYGFLPSGGGKCPRLDALISANAGRDEINWAREEFIMNYAFDDPEMFAALQAAWEFSGVDCTFLNSGQESNDTEHMLHRLSNYTNLIDRKPELYNRGIFPAGVPDARTRGQKTIFFTTNGVPLPAKLNSTFEALNYIGVYSKLGVRMMHLTYNRRNLIGDGCAESADAGLSGFGRDVIAEMNRCCVIPDVAHSGQKTSYDAAKASAKPVVASHSAVRKFSTHYRAKNDEVIAAIKESGGFVGICCHPPFLQGSMYIDSMLDHIEYIARKFGVDHVAIGTDHGLLLAPLTTASPMRSERPIWEQFWPAPGAGYELMTKAQYDSVSWLNWPMFTVGLVQRGFTDEEIRKIIGGNVMRVITETLEK